MLGKVLANSLSISVMQKAANGLGEIIEARMKGPTQEGRMARPVSISEEQLRAVGFTAAAAEFPRTDEAMKKFCTWYGITPEVAPPGFWFYPNEYCRDKWEGGEWPAGLRAGGKNE